MRPSTIVVVLAAGGAAFAAGWWLRPDAAAPQAPTTATASGPAASDVAGPDGPRPSEDPSSATAPKPPPLQMLERCASRLVEARSAAARCRDRDDSASVDIDACVRHPDVRAALGAAALAATDAGDDDTGEAPARDATTSRDPAFARRFARQVVGVSEDDARWLERYMCSVHTLREDMVDQVHDLLEDGATTEQIDSAVAEARQERKTVLADVEKRLGPEAYARLRAVGGVGLLGQALDCPSG